LVELHSITTLLGLPFSPCAATLKLKALLLSGQDLMLIGTTLLQPPFTRPGARFQFTSLVARAVDDLIATAGRGFFDGLLDRFTGFAGALLNAAQQFILFAFGELKVVIRELGPLLLQLAFGNVPITFDFECCHNALVYLFFLIRRQRGGKSVLAALGVRHSSGWHMPRAFSDGRQHTIIEKRPPWKSKGVNSPTL
jgi:hypothetical protein